MKLTSRQNEILRFIKKHLIAEQCTPTVREIGRQFGIRSTNGVACHLKALEKKGVLELRPCRQRNIRLLGVSLKLERRRRDGRRNKIEAKHD